MPLDDRLLQAQTKSIEDEEENTPDSSADRAGSLREAQGDKNDLNQEGDLRTQVMAAKRSRKMNLETKQVEMEKSLSFGTSNLLKSAWKKILVSWGFSFLYVYVHLFLQNVFGKKLFAPLGSEWDDKPGITIKQREKLGKRRHLVETMGVGACSVVILFSVVALFGGVALIIEVVTNPLHSAFNFIWSWLSNNS